MHNRKRLGMLLMAITSVLALSCGTVGAVGVGETARKEQATSVIPTGSMRQIGSYTTERKNVNKLELDLDCTEVQIYKSDTSAIKLVASANWDVAEKEKVQFILRDKTLTVKSGEWESVWEKGWVPSNYRSSYTDNRRQKLEIYLPADYQDIMDIELDASSLNSSIPLKLSAITLDVDASSAAFSTLETATAKFDVDAGSIEATALTVGSATLDVDAASASLKNVTVQKMLKIECDAGSAEIELARGQGFSFTGEWDMGDLSTYFPTTKNLKSKYYSSGSCTGKVGDGTATILAEVDVGTLAITEKAAKN